MKADTDLLCPQRHKGLLCHGAQSTLYRKLPVACADAVVIPLAILGRVA